MSNVIELKVAAVAGEPRIDSRLIAPALGIKHASLIETVRKCHRRSEIRRYWPV